MSQRYFITLPDPSAARGSDPALSFQAHGADAFAQQLQEALTSSALFERWRAQQENPDEVDPALGETDPAATVQGSASDLAIDLVANTRLPGNIVSQRMRWLAGSAWQLRDVRSA